MVATLSDSERETIQEQTDDVLIEMWQSYRDSAAHSRLGSNYVEYILQKRMEEKGASRLPSLTHDVKMERDYTTDADALVPLREHIEPAILDLGYTPEHQETVAERWDMRKVNSWMTYGDEVKAIIENSRQWQPAQLSIKPKRK